MLSIVFLNFIVRLSPEMIEFLKEQIDEDCSISTGDRIQGRSRKITVMAAMYNGGMLHSEILAANGNTVTCAHYIDELAAARDRLGIANEEAVVLDYVGFHHSRDV